MNAEATDGPQRARAIRPEPALHVTGGGGSGRRLVLNEDEGTIGRRDDNTYVLDDPSVSRVHARISRQGNTVIITDLGSSGGTKVNGEDIEGPTALNNGDTVQLGATELRFEDPVAASTDNAEPTMVFEVPTVETGPSLSPRQQQVIELIAEGMTNSEIGDELGITERTVKAYAQEIYDKLGVRNRAGAVAEAVKHDIL